MTDCRCLELQLSGEEGFCATDHRYWARGVEYWSVTRVIRELMPSGYEAVAPAVLENARERGVAVEGYFWRWLRSEDGLVVPADERLDVRDRFFALCEWWAKTMPADTEVLHIQPALFDHEAQIAGMADLILGVNGAAVLVDLKCLYRLFPWHSKLQLGAYATMAHDDIEAVSILQSTARGVKMVNYDLDDCRDAWDDARRWWMRRKQLLGGSNA